eukprot:TRINITY_DN2738_c0_g1_i1.p1 TRINITY_DN2738_c0_g1~~TRINITY_DN2738_c0_g1_i1.p1  ORF type:complete len:1051 (-),score=369.92 TRINITY_DN2738_c0_g1_i1:6-2927(-)
MLASISSAEKYLLAKWRTSERLENGACRYFVTCTEHKIYIWDLEKVARQQREVDVGREKAMSIEEAGGEDSIGLTNEEDGILDVSFSRDGGVLAVATRLGFVKLYDFGQRAILHQWSPHNGEAVQSVIHVGAGATERLLTLGLWNRQMKLWQAEGPQRSGADPKLLQTITAVGDSQEEHVMNHVAVDSRCQNDGASQLLMLANIHESALHLLHLDHAKGRFTAATRFDLKQPILSFCLPDQHPAQPRLQLFCIQTRDIQTLQVPANCFSFHTPASPVEKIRALMRDSQRQSVDSPALPASIPAPEQPASSQVAQDADLQQDREEDQPEQQPEEQEQEQEQEQKDETDIEEQALEAKPETPQEETPLPEKTSSPLLPEPSEAPQAALAEAETAPAPAPSKPPGFFDSDESAPPAEDRQPSSQAGTRAGRTSSGNRDEKAGKKKPVASPQHAFSQSKLYQPQPSSLTSQLKSPKKADDKRPPINTQPKPKSSKPKASGSAHKIQILTRESSDQLLNQAQPNLLDVNSMQSIDAQLCSSQALSKSPFSSEQRPQDPSVLQQVQQLLQVQQQRLDLSALPLQPNSLPLPTAEPRFDGLQAVLKAHLDHQTLMFEQERAERRKFEASLLAQTKNTASAMKQAIESAVQKEVQEKLDQLTRAMFQKIDSTIAPSVQDAAKNAIQSASARSENLIKDAVDKSIQRQFPLEVKKTLEESIRKNFQASLIPTIEATCQKMFEQINSTMASGMDHIQNSYASNASGPPHGHSGAAWHENAALLEQLRQSAHTLTNISTTVSKSVIDSQNSLMAMQLQFQKFVGASERSPASEGALAVPQNIAAKISHQIRSKNYAEAFRLALGSEDLAVLVPTISQLDPKLVSSDPEFKKRQSMVLSLIQQLAFNLTQDMQIKSVWLKCVLLILEPSDPEIAYSSPGVLGEVYQKIEGVFRMRQPIDPLVEENLKISLHFTNSFLSSFAKRLS